MFKASYICLKRDFSFSLSMKSCVSPEPNIPFVSKYAFATKSSRVPFLFSLRSSSSMFSTAENFFAYNSALLSTIKMFLSSKLENCLWASSSRRLKSASVTLVARVSTRNKAFLFRSTLAFFINWLNCVDSRACPETGFKKMIASAFSMY